MMYQLLSLLPIYLCLVLPYPNILYDFSDELL
ncbi:hypothetical protein SAMN05216564_11240 [Halopenitus persicus]|uniref:Uncharacterized protein n=1 Tax=Halopenitus persicus TaxID=1048396 RepID=A0A1H3NBS7_9EURY|nr:hypothetical protein SAMN05216564_11240 [Halopenitus persicus]